MQQLEQKLDELLVKKAPFQLPENLRRGLVTALPWLTLVGGILMIFAAMALWPLLTIASSLAVFTYVQAVNFMPLLWISWILLVVEAILFFVAFPSLREQKKKGWNILFWVSIVNIVEAVLQAVSYTDFKSLVMSLLGSLVGLYVLFQVRAYYTGEKKIAAAPSASGTMNVPKETPAAKPVVKPTDSTDDTTPKV